MIIGVIGARGNLGRRLVQAGCLPIECDLLDGNSIDYAIKEINPDVIINAAGKTDIVWCEKHSIKTHGINVFGLERLLDTWQGKIVHISCDCIYNGHTGHYWEMEDDKFPMNSLAMSKYFQENLLLQKRRRDYLLVRTSELYDTNTPNITNLLERMKPDKSGMGRAIAGAEDIFFTPTYIPHLVTSLLELVNRNLDGIYHLAGTTYINESTFCQTFCELMGYKNYYRAGVAMRDLSVRQPKRLGLHTGKAENIHLPLFSFYDGMTELVKELKNVGTN